MPRTRRNRFYCRHHAVAHDHEEYLGTSLRSIGMEKFAVVRPETPALYSGEPPELEDLFLERCSLAKAEPTSFAASGA